MVVKMGDRRRGKSSQNRCQTAAVSGSCVEEVDVVGRSQWKKDAEVSRR